MSLVQQLPKGSLDIVGDIHGEFDALCNLLRHLGYDDQGQHTEGRSLVFVGDFCDRGPNSPAVLELLQRLLASGRAVAVLGNHEINLLRNTPKDGSGWFFDERVERDQKKYAPFARPTSKQRTQIMDLIAHLPIALERDDLRIVHAAWLDGPIHAARQLAPGALRQAYDRWEEQAKEQALHSGLAQRVNDELKAWGYGLENEKLQPPFLHAQAEHDASQQMLNPLKVLTSGVERKGLQPFFSGGKWRFAERVRWWDEYEHAIPVVVGHYWRRVHHIDRARVGKGDADLFEAINPLHWHGKHRNVFCVDYSVGGRWEERKESKPLGHDFKLAALRWPEKTLQFDDGSHLPSQGFSQP